MKVLVCLNNLWTGGVGINAIELGAALRDAHGFEMTFFAEAGPLLELIQEKRLSFYPAPDGPSLKRMLALRDVVRLKKPDLVHAWEWWQWYDVFYAVHLPMRIPMLISDMGMIPRPVMPKSVRATYGTPQLRDLARAEGRCAELLMPPVDVHANAPEAVDPRPFRTEFGLREDDTAIVIVSRLARSMKSESLFRSVDAVHQLGRDLPLRLLIVGEGAMRPSLQARADEVNRALLRRAVILTGERLDPRPAYAAADIVIGMGSSALRGLAFSKPVVVVGEGSFAAVFTPETADKFCYRGMYGYGDVGDDNSHLVASVRELASHSERWEALGGYSRQFVVQHFALEGLAARLAQYSEAAVADIGPLSVAIADAVRSCAVSLRGRQVAGLPMGPVVRRMLGLRFTEEYRNAAEKQSKSLLRRGQGPLL